MLRCSIYTLGKVRESYVLSGEEVYRTRLTSDCKLSLHEIDVDKFASRPQEERKKKEAELFLSKLADADYLFLLDEKGKSFTSPDFAAQLQDLQSRGSSHIAFAIGGAAGWDASAKERADALLSLSPMTFPYQMTRLVLIEQLYRALSILKGRNYHK